MRMKTIQAVSTAARWVQRVLETRLPMGAAYGLRTAERRFWRQSNLWMVHK
jgi:hypothetical protein